MENTNEAAGAAILARLYELQDEDYADFTSKLIPTVPRERLIGVRLPALRALAKELASAPEAEAFLSALPHRFHEENLLHAMLLEPEKDLDVLIERLDAFLPYIDNWAVCDTLRSGLLRSRFEDALEHIRRWAESDHPYTVRFAVLMLMTYGLDDRFSPEWNDIAARIRSEEYYVNMMRAWYFATALAKKWDGTLPYLDGRLDEWTHNKTIQKAIESYRIPEERKALLRTMKRGGKRRRIDVAAGVIWRDGRVLICRRPEGKARALGWEFPGGKLEHGESAEQALVREVSEELACRVRPISRLTEVLYEYPDVTVRLIAINAELESGEPSPLEHSELSFVLPDELFGYALCPADRLIAAAIVNERR